MSSITEIVNGVIYLLTSPSGKQYVGQAWEFEKRMSDYRRGGCKGQRALHNAITKYGWENFTATAIAQGIQTQAALDATESAFIALLGTMRPHGYNLKLGGNGGGKHHAETKAKLSAANRGKKLTAETRAKIGAANRGRKHTAETRAKIGKAHRGVPKSPEHCAKLSAAHRGKVISAETKAKMSVANSGEKHPNFGKRLSAETRAKISAAKRNRKSMHNQAA